MALEGVLDEQMPEAFALMRTNGNAVSKQVSAGEENEKTHSREQVGVDQETVENDNTQKSVQAFRLLDLPAELMLRILELAVVRSSGKHPISIHSAFEFVANSSVGAKCREQLAQPAITKTCRLLRDEGLPIFYSQNAFTTRADGWRNTARWLMALTEAQRSLLTLSCRLLGPYPCKHSLRNALRELAGEVAQHTPELKIVTKKESATVPMHFSTGGWACTMAFRELPGMALRRIDDVHDELLNDFECDKNVECYLLDLSTTDRVHRVSLKAKGCIS